MICQYCKKSTLKDYTAVGVFDCQTCNVSFFIFKGGEVQSICFQFDHHQIDIDYEDGKTRLFKVDYPESDNPDYTLLLKLPHIIPIDPARKDYWLHKLLNLLVYA